MQIKDLPNSSALSPTDVFAKDSYSGETTKITGQTMAAQIKSIGELLGRTDVVNNLDTVASDLPISAAVARTIDNKVELLNDYVSEAAQYLKVQPGGVAVGKASSGSVTAPLFECAYPAVFSGNVTVPAEGLLKTVEVTVASEEAVEGGATASYTVPVNAGDGWTPVGIVGYRANSRWVMMIRSYLDDNGEAACTVYNHGTPSRNVTIIMYVLCLRTG